MEIKTQLPTLHLLLFFAYIKITVETYYRLDTNRMYLVFIVYFASV